MPGNRSRYFAVNGDKLEELLDTESLISFLSDKEKADIFSDVLGSKLTVNTFTGHVRIMSSKQQLIRDPEDPEQKKYVVLNSPIVTVFTERHFQSVTIPVSEAIVLSAKRELLQRIYQLEDPSINSIIKRRGHIDRDGNFINLNSIISIDHTLHEIRKSGNPPIFRFLFAKKDVSKLHGTVARELKNFEKIRGRKDIQVIMENISKKMTTPENRQRASV